MKQAYTLFIGLTAIFMLEMSTVLQAGLLRQCCTYLFQNHTLVFNANLEYCVSPCFFVDTVAVNKLKYPSF